MTNLKKLTLDVHSSPGQVQFSYGGVMFEKCSLESIQDTEAEIGTLDQSKTARRIRLKMAEQFDLTYDESIKIWDYLEIEASGNEPDPTVRGGENA